LSILPPLANVCGSLMFGLLPKTVDGEVHNSICGRG
jgi:hypothetical protein